MAGYFGSRGRGERGSVGAYGPYRRDRGAIGAGRSLDRRESWSWRGGAPRGDFRGARPGGFGGFGRGRVGQFPPPPAGGGRGGSEEQAHGRWVWQDDGRQSPVQGKESSAGKPSEVDGGAPGQGSNMDLDLYVEGGGSMDGGDAIKVGGRCSRCSKKGHLAAACKVEVYCVIYDSHDHMNHKCHLLKAPRPVAHAVGYAVMA